MAFEIRLTYILLRLFLLISMGLIGYYISKKKKWKWEYTIIPTVIFGLIEGLRYMRGTDYPTYFERYITINSLDPWSYEEDPLFVILCQFLLDLNIPFQGFIILCSVILIFSSFFLLKEQKHLMLFSLPLITILGMTDAENLIRWYLAFSFFLIGIYYLIKNKWIYFFIFSLIACGFHLGLIIVVPVFFLIYNLKNKVLIKPLYACLIFIILWQTFRPEFMLIFVDLFANFAGLGRYTAYINNIDIWLTGDNKDLLLEVTKTDIYRFLFLIYYGYKVADKQKSPYTYFYNLFLIGAITYPALRIIELPFRYNLLFIFFEAFVAAAVLKEYLILRQKKDIHTLFSLAYFYPVLARIFKYAINFDITELLFIWHMDIFRTVNPFK